MATDQIMDDGTPVAEVLQELRERRAEVAALKKTLRTIQNLADAPHFDSERRWKIRDLARAAGKER